MSDTSAPLKERPLSPHLSVYKPIPTMMMSILHRITGVGLYVGSAFFAWWLIAAANGADAYAQADWFFGSLIGRLILFAFTFALIHHMLGGLKHLVQDTGRALGKETTTKMAIAQPIVAIVLTVLIWVIGYITRGVL